MSSTSAVREVSMFMHEMSLKCVRLLLNAWDLAALELRHKIKTAKHESLRLYGLIGMYYLFVMLYMYYTITLEY